MIDQPNLTLISKIWPDTDEHDYTDVRACHLHELVRILNLARKEGRREGHLTGRGTTSAPIKTYINDRTRRTKVVSND